jgi:hypothetical protein
VDRHLLSLETGTDIREVLLGKKYYCTVISIKDIKTTDI